MTISLLRSLLLSCTMLIGTQAVFVPADRAALKTAVGTCTWGENGYVCTGGCLGETADGSCPILAASNVPGTGNPYGVIGDWDVSAVTTMENSKCTLSPLLCGHVQFSHVLLFLFCVFETGPCCCCLCGGFGLSFLCCTLSLQCLMAHLRSIRTCPNGIRGR